MLTNINNDVLSANKL